MKAITANTIGGNPLLNKYLILAMVMVILILAGFLANRTQQKPDTAAIRARKEITSLA